MTRVAPTLAAQGAAQVEGPLATRQLSGQGAFEGMNFERFDDVMIGPPRVTKPPRNLLVISDDQEQCEVIRQCAPSLDYTPVFLSDSLLFINAILKPFAKLDHDTAPDPYPELPDLLVMGGSTPAWVQMEMAARIVTACKAQHKKAPALLFLLSFGDMPSFESVLDLESLDFLMCPIHAAEFKIRLKRLFALRKSKPSAVVTAHDSEDLHDHRPQETQPTPQLLPALDSWVPKLQGPQDSVDAQAIRSWGPYRFDARNQQVTLRGDVKYLPLREFNIAWILFTHMDQTVTYDALIAQVFTRTRTVEKDQSRLLGSYVSRLRSNLGLSDQGEYKLLAIYGVGYRLTST
jgi:DNA-binding response OmpR family regulator